VFKFFCFLLCCLPFIAQSQSELIPLWRSNYDSAQFFWKKNIEKSLHHLQDAERIASNDLGIYDESYLTILNDLALAYSQVKDYKQAENCLKRNLAIQYEIYPMADPRVLQSQCNLATILLKSGADNQAKQIYKDVLKSAHDLQQGLAYRIASGNLIKLYETHEQLDSARIIIKDVLTTEFSDSTIQYQYEFRLAEGRILRKEKKYNEAEQVLTAFKRDLSSVSPHAQSFENSVIVELSLINIEMGLYERAERDLLQLYRSLKSSSAADETLLTELTNGLAYVYEKLGVYDKALAYYQEALNKCAVAYGYNSIACLIMQNNIAGVYLKQDMVKEAIVEYERFIKISKNLIKNNATTYLIALNNLGTAYRQDGQFEVALQYFYDVYGMLEQRQLLRTDLASTVMNNIAVTYLLKGDYIAATDYFEKVLQIKERLYGSESPVLLDVISNLAIAYWAIQNNASAIPLFQRSLTIARKEVKYIFPNLTETEQVQFYQRHKQNFERFNTLSTQSANVEPELLVQMFNNQLLLKSLVFFTNKKRHNRIQQKSDAHLNDMAVLAQIKGIQLGHFYQMPLSELKSIGVSLQRLENEIDSLEKIIRHSLNNEAYTTHTAGWRDIQQSIKPNEALIEIIRFRKYDVLTEDDSISAKQVSIGFTDSIYYAALVTTMETTDFPQLVILKNGNHLEKRFLNYYRNTLKYDVDDTISYSQFWKPFQSHLPGKEKVYFSGDGVFHRINLNAIHDSAGKYILEKYDIYQILNSGQLAERVEEKAITFSKVVLMGDPVFQSDPIEQNAIGSKDYESLPGTLAEVQGIINVLKVRPSHLEVFMGQAANEVNLRKVNSPSILHIATHGFFSTDLVYLNDQAKNDFLFHSGIVLSTSYRHTKSKESNFDYDGVVTAYEVMNLDLSNTDLVVLSACDTGLGKVENGEGVYGLQRSFLQAGADNILISLWKVEDLMTKDLMVKFYSYLGQQYSSREAFKLAQLDMLHEVGNPRLWAGFVMINGN